VRGVDHESVAEVDPDVRDRLGAVAEEEQVAGLQLRGGGSVRAGVVLLLRGARQVDAGVGVGPLGQAGAVEPAGVAAAPDVRGAEHRGGGLDGDVGGGAGLLV
jgi:hypothetical protein